MGVRGQLAVGAGLPGRDEVGRLAAAHQAESLEPHQDDRAEAVIDLGEVDVLRLHLRRLPETVAVVGVRVDRPVLPVEEVRDVEARPGRRRPGGPLDDRRRVLEVPCAVERGDQHGAGAVHLGGAVVAAERVDDELRPEVVLHGQRVAPDCAGIGLRVLALGDRHLPEALVAGAGLDHVAAPPHRDVLRVGAEADRVAERRGWRAEAGGADPDAGAAVEGTVDEHVLRHPGLHRHRGDGDRVAGRLAAEAEVGGEGELRAAEPRRHALGGGRVAEHAEGDDPVDFLGFQAGVDRRVAAGLDRERLHADAGVLAQRRVADPGDRGLAEEAGPLVVELAHRAADQRGLRFSTKALMPSIESGSVRQ